MKRYLIPSLVALALMGACARNVEQEDQLLAKKTDSAIDLIGGPAALSQVGDFLLKNDKIRFIVGGPEHSWSFGVYGGSVIDADLVRSDGRFQAGAGKDAFGELFPTVNLVTPNPVPDQVEIVEDGSNGTNASLRVVGEGSMIFDILKILSNSLLQVLFKEIKTDFYFETVYNLSKGADYLEISTAAYKNLPLDTFCGEFKCDLDCTDGGKYKKSAYKLEERIETVEQPKNGQVPHLCPICECDEARELETLTGPAPMLSYIAGDIHPLTETLGNLLAGLLKIDLDGVYSGGLVGGDYLFFGAKTDVWLPGLGYDESKRIFEDLYEGRDSLSNPLAADYVVGVGDGVSYIYFTKDPPSGEKAQILIPLITSSATVVITSAVRCLQSADDNAECDWARRWTFSRYFGLGKGDVGSALDVYYRVRNGVNAEGMPNGVGSIRGRVYWAESLQPITHADVFAVRAPEEKPLLDKEGEEISCSADESCKASDAKARCRLGTCVKSTCDFSDYDGLLRCNINASKVDRDGDGTLDVPGNPGILNHWQSDVGEDPLPDGNYGGYMAPGTYYLVARLGDTALSELVLVDLEEGEELVANMVIGQTGEVQYRVTDDLGYLVPAKIVFYALDKDGQPLLRDGTRRIELGDGRYQHGMRKQLLTKDGQGSAEVEPGLYKVVVSRGFEYSIDVFDRFEVKSGKPVQLNAHLRREVDTTGWISGDFHLHAMPSTDAGLPLDTRVIHCAAEGLELITSTDHDIVVDYDPYIRDLGLQGWLTSQVGVEVSTMEMGHFNAYPIDYNHTMIPDRNSIDWVCKGTPELFAEMRSLGTFGPEMTVVQANHPTDGVMGYFSQMGLDPYSLDRRMMVFGMDVGGLQAQVGQYLEMAKGLLKNDAVVLDFLKKNPVDVTVLPNPLHRKVSCDFDAMELQNAKRFEFMRVPTVREVNDFNRCILSVRQIPQSMDLYDAESKQAVMAVCPELQDSPDCAEAVTDPDALQRCLWTKDLKNELEVCNNANLTVYECKEAARYAFAKYAIRTMLQKTPEEQNERLMAQDTMPVGTEEEPAGYEYCSVEHALANDVPAEMLEEPCSDRYGVVDVWFRLLNDGKYATGMSNSDSHDTFFEAGMPRTYVKSSTDNPAFVDIKETTRAVLEGKTMPTSGPFVEIAVEGAGPGERVALKGDKVDIDLKVQTPSWFGVDRLEIYRNGLLEKVIYPSGVVAGEPGLATSPEAIVDFDDTVSLPKPDKDSWYVVIALGLNEENLLEQVYTTPAFGNLLLPEILSMAFGGLLPEGINLPLSPTVPDYFPMFAVGITNPVFVDIDGDSYQSPRRDTPLFCEHYCKPEADAEGKPTKSDCPPETKDLVCLEDAASPKGGICGLSIAGSCVYEPTETAHAPLMVDDSNSPFVPLTSGGGRTLMDNKKALELKYLNLLMMKFRK